MAKQKLVEQFVVSPSQYEKIEFSELEEGEKTLSINEAGKKKTYKAEAVYTFPISRPGEKNLNERIYPVKLWEKVIKEKQGNGSYGLMDHPTNEGSTKDAWCVWRNTRFSEDKKLVLADAYLFGPWGRQVKEALEAGGNVGLSTSGFGEFEKDEMTVKADSYELERVADHVLNPSYSVFGTQEDAVETEKQTESLESKEELQVSESNQTIKNDTSSNDKEKTMEYKKLNSFEEKSFRLNVQSQIKEIDKEEKPSIRESLYSDLLSYFEEGVAEDLREKLEEKLENTRKEIQELAEKGASFDKKVEESKKELTERINSLITEKEEVRSTLEEMTEKFDKASELLDSMKAYSNKLKEMYEVAVAEKNGMITATEYKETLVYIESLEEEKKALKESVQMLRDSLEEMKVDTEEEKKKKKKKMTDEDDDEDEEDEDDDDDDDDEEEVEEKKKKKKEDYSHVKPEILDYYRDLEYAMPAVKEIKEEILSSNTLLEAQRTYLRLKSLIFVEDHERREMPSSKSKFFTEDSSKKIKSISKNSFNPHHEGWV